MVPSWGRLALDPRFSPSSIKIIEVERLSPFPAVSRDLSDGIASTGDGTLAEREPMSGPAGGGAKESNKGNSETHNKNYFLKCGISWLLRGLTTNHP